MYFNGMFMIDQLKSKTSIRPSPRSGRREKFRPPSLSRSFWRNLGFPDKTGNISRSSRVGMPGEAVRVESNIHQEDLSSCFDCSAAAPQDASGDAAESFLSIQKTCTGSNSLDPSQQFCESKNLVHCCMTRTKELLLLNPRFSNQSEPSFLHPRIIS
ncbi:hypothetical protein ILYODFUR_037038 [Ilyodon furcidens]|uniref:Uncharacterized protein n=1 Tax=Ilyodon furcidens TaxID=33524 RepID=A0ABV0UP25_9TELE